MGLLGLILAVVGVYSVVSYAAVQRTHEIGIRMALGAAPQDILRMVLRQSVVLVGAGLAVGLAASLAGTRDCQFNRRSATHGSGYFRGRRSPVNSDCFGGLLDTGAACHARQSVSGAAVRITILLRHRSIDPRLFGYRVR